MSAFTQPVHTPSPTEESIASWRAEDVEQVRAKVFAVILDFHQVRLRSDDGHQYAITRLTQGVRLDDLHEGQTVDLIVSRELPRVLSAQVVA